MHNRDEFVREMTLRICSNLEIKESLRSAFEFLRDEIPLDVLLLFLLDERLGAVRHIAHAADKGAVLPDVIIPMPEGMPEAIAARDFREAFIVAPETDEIFSAMGPMAKLKGNSDLIVPLRIKEELSGGLVLRARGENRYNQEHVDLVGCLAKPFSVALANALAHEEVLRYQSILLDDKRFLHRELNPVMAEEIIGDSTGLSNVMEMVRQVAPLNNTVLILGETGTGKELIANAIHYSSSRKDAPFIKVNCGALPENLIDSELFGHERGAFTGAIAESRGRFERAEGGTIFLDEIGELPQTAQVRLLRVLQHHEVERVGGKRPLPVDIRVIAATHRNLQEMVTNGSFREDLWYRLSGFPMIVPPLRQRKEDVPALTRHFVALKSKEFGIGYPPSIAPGALQRLMEYSWPGNVRELENIVEREIILHRGGPLTFEMVPKHENRSLSKYEDMAESPTPLLKLEDAMAAHLSAVLKLPEGKIHGPGGAAELLGMNANTLRWRLDKLGISYRRRMRGKAGE